MTLIIAFKALAWTLQDCGDALAGRRRVPGGPPEAVQAAAQQGGTGTNHFSLHRLGSSSRKEREHSRGPERG
jgi:hypothetical protein